MELYKAYSKDSLEISEGETTCLLPIETPNVCYHNNSGWTARANSLSLAMLPGTGFLVTFYEDDMLPCPYLSLILFGL